MEMSANQSSNLTVSDLVQYIEYLKYQVRISRKILGIYTVIIIILGTIFNIINFVYFYRIKKRNSQNVFLSALSLAELFNIHINIMIPFIQYRFFESWKKRKEWVCILEGYLIEVFLFLPNWIVVILVAERFLSIKWPLRKNVICTPHNARIILTCLLITILSWSLFKLKTAGVENDSIFTNRYNYNESGLCRKIEIPNLVHFSIILWAVVPGFISFILNMSIIKKIKLKTNKNKQHYPINQIRRATQATRVVLIISILFIILTSPAGFMLIADKLINFNANLEINIQNPNNSTYVNVLIVLILKNYAHMLYEMNMIINFPIYLYTIKNFR
jgi:hypothetical protein